MTMTEEQQVEMARQIDEATSQLGPVVRSLHQSGVGHQAMCMALVSMAAHHALHDGATIDDLLLVAKSAWAGAVEVHARECSTS